MSAGMTKNRQYLHSPISSCEDPTTNVAESSSLCSITTNSICTNRYKHYYGIRETTWMFIFRKTRAHSESHACLKKRKKKNGTRRRDKLRLRFIKRELVLKITRVSIKRARELGDKPCVQFIKRTRDFKNVHTKKKTHMRLKNKQTNKKPQNIHVTSRAQYISDSGDKSFFCYFLH